MRFRSRSETGIISSYSRAARFDRLRRRWLLPCRVRTSLPEPVYSNRRAAALWVFNFGIRSTGLASLPYELLQTRLANPLGRDGLVHLGTALARELIGRARKPRQV